MLKKDLLFKVLKNVFSRKCRYKNRGRRNDGNADETGI